MAKKQPQPSSKPPTAKQAETPPVSNPGQRTMRKNFALSPNTLMRFQQEVFDRRLARLAAGDDKELSESEVLEAFLQERLKPLRS